MTDYTDDQDRRDTAEENHDRALAKRDRLMDRAPAGTAEPPLPDMSPSTVDVLPRDLDDHRAARERVEALAEDYEKVSVDRLPPMGALHWLVTGYRADGSADTFRVGASGSLMPWPVKP